MGSLLVSLRVSFSMIITRPAGLRRSSYAISRYSMMQWTAVALRDDAERLCSCRSGKRLRYETNALSCAAHVYWTAARMRFGGVLHGHRGGCTAVRGSADGAVPR